MMLLSHSDCACVRVRVSVCGRVFGKGNLINLCHAHGSDDEQRVTMDLVHTKISLKKELTQA